ncbi:MAG: PDZ domain-containing protein, partial [Flavobacterium sp.]|nr:PDZ domain-containing protein [Flavobacterium sp.]
ILKRFTVVFDYPRQKMFLRKNNDFSAPFSYNKSGVELQHNGLQWVQETVHLETVIRTGDEVDTKVSNGWNNFKYKFELKPVYIIANVRKNSPAAISGLQKGDIVVRINATPAYQFNLEKINSLLKSEEEKWITFEVDRDGKLIIYKFQLHNVL